ncbi:Protein MEI2-like 6, partial [Linum perenne]
PFCFLSLNIVGNFVFRRRGHLIQYLDKHCHDENSKAVARFASSSVGGSRCLLSEYDFLYLPMDFRTGANLGYAFVNFTNSVGASRFRESFDNYSWNVPAGNNKICKITSATIQGKEALLDNFNNSKFKCDRKYYLPVVFSPARNGVNRSDPNPVGQYFQTPRPPKHVHHGKRRPTN